MFLDHVIDAVLILGFPFGVFVGYMWRDRISRSRRARYLAERNGAARDAWQAQLRSGTTLPSARDGNRQVAG